MLHVMKKSKSRVQFPIKILAYINNYSMSLEKEQSHVLSVKCT